MSWVSKDARKPPYYMTVVSDELSKVRNEKLQRIIIYYVYCSCRECWKDQREDTIDCIDYMSWVSKDQTQNRKQCIDYMSWVSKDAVLLRIIMQILIQSIRITIFFELNTSNYTKLRIKPSNYKHFELNYM